MGRKEITKAVNRFRRRMQKIVDGNKGITKITMQVEDEPPVIIAEKKDKRMAGEKE